MTTPRISSRPLRPGDLEAMAELLGRCLPTDPVSPRLLRDRVLLEPNHRPGGLQLAESGDGTLLGFLYATCAEGGIPAQPEQGYLTVGAVDPALPDAGDLAGRLVDGALEHLRERGARQVTIGGYPQGYFWPGVDRTAWPQMHELLLAHGFTAQGESVAMRISLDGWQIPEQDRELRAQQEAAGYRLSLASADDMPETIAFAATRLAPDWATILRAAAPEQDDGRHVLIIRAPDGHVVGVSTYGSYRDSIERFGPYGVDEEQRGRGLGRTLLNATLRAQQAEGAHTSWFLWTGEHSPAGILYRKVGFEVYRRFTTMRRAL
ncbi:MULTISPECIES: GNAT family N-acetyltransferase [unclassified Brachybacterium]|uniref:GNAT family N-acetyltransferase n=1 Tax=unclassified Brachybacterium TaxID=2623841 RepID=UPI000C80DB70|nr:MULTISPECIES: GNAT family N-acetyltransferase [unclassified Brachybacterium]PMC75971.1 hypothetical protein CJ197_04705 [Brachybacterium sp. UMB0905]